MKLTVPQDCDQAPKRRILRDLNIAFAKADLEGMIRYFHANIIWDMVGDKSLSGLEEVVQYLHSIKDLQAKELRIKQVISHGKYGSAIGELVFDHQTVAFHDFYEFSSASSDRIKKISSMAISI